MNPVTIRPLQGFDAERFRHIASGYTSPEKYAVTRHESPGETTITLALRTLDQPYSKRYDHDDAMLAFYGDVVQEGLSLGAYANAALVGVAIAGAQQWNRTLWVWELHVDAAYRGQGVGRRLVAGLVEVARREHLRAIVCETQNTNLPAIHFYRAAGFELDGVDLSYYTNSDATEGEVALFMKRKLPPDFPPDFPPDLPPDLSSSQRPGRQSQDDIEDTP